MDEKLILCSRVRLDKLIVTQLVKKFPTFYGVRQFFFFTVIITVRQLTLSWARSLQSTTYQGLEYASIERETLQADPN
jgi:hypothetical protein